MNEARLGSWSVPESPVAIEYSLLVIEEIRHHVAEGFQRLSRGGVEVGGLLYGRREGQTLVLLAIRPLECEHAHGPGFILSDKDRAALEAQLETGLEDPRLEGFLCMGWFVSHTRSEIALSPQDLELFSKYLPEPWQVTLVIRPGRGGSMRAGFFVRETDGSVKPERSYLEFNFPDRLAGVLDRPPRPDRVRGDRRMGGLARAEAPAQEEGSALSLSRETPGPALLEPFGTTPVPAPRPGLRWYWIVGSVALLLLALTIFVLRPFLARSSADSVGLTVMEKNGQLQVEWNHSARPILTGVRGSVRISDGKTVTTLPLTAQDLIRGNVTYQRETGDVEVRIAVESAKGERVQEASRFLGRPPVRLDPAEWKALQEERDRLQAEVDRLKTENDAQNERVQQLERTLRILQTRLSGQ